MFEFHSIKILFKGNYVVCRLCKIKSIWVKLKCNYIPDVGIPALKELLRELTSSLSSSLSILLISISSRFKSSNACPTKKQKE